MRGHRAEIAHSTPAELRRIRVENLVPVPTGWQSESVAGAGQWGHVGHAHRGSIAIIPTDPTEHVGTGIVGVNPLKSTRVIITLPQCGGCAVDTINLLQRPLNAQVLIELE